MTQKIVMDYAFSFLGTPYRWGGDDPLLGIDCSGLVLEVLKAAGVYKGAFDTTAQGLYDDLTKNKSAALTNSPAPMALAFYGKSNKAITHVALCVCSTKVLEAGGGGHKVVDVASAAAANAFVRIRPIDHRIDLVAIVNPIYFWSV
jgi:cell wall-associated NlpC family hydrolase